MGPHQIALGLLLVVCTTVNAQRSPAERLAFIRENPCPSTGHRRGACPGWEVDHVQALVCGGQDSRYNMQWLSVADHREKTRKDMRGCRAIARPTPH